MLELFTLLHELIVVDTMLGDRLLQVLQGQHILYCVFEGFYLGFVAALLVVVIFLVLQLSFFSKLLDLHLAVSFGNLYRGGDMQGSILMNTQNKERLLSHSDDLEVLTSTLLVHNLNFWLAVWFIHLNFHHHQKASMNGQNVRQGWNNICNNEQLIWICRILNEVSHTHHIVSIEQVVQPLVEKLEVVSVFQRHSLQPGESVSNIFILKPSKHKSPSSLDILHLNIRSHGPIHPTIH